MVQPAGRKAAARLVPVPVSFPAMTDPDTTPFLQRLREITDVLEQVAADRTLLVNVPEPDRRRLVNAAGKVYSPDAHARRQFVKATHRRDKANKVNSAEAILAATGIRSLRRQTVFTTPNYFPPSGFVQEDREVELPYREAGEAQNCYICKTDFTAIHHFYDSLCPNCAVFNFAKRSETADLTGRVALLTGGRVKIGYQAGIKLLRAGAHLIVTTRFPRDSAARYAEEVDFSAWGHRLEIIGLDLRHTPSVEAFCHHLLETHERLDFIINNACQTVRRPPEFYRHMMEREAGSFRDMPEPARRLLRTHDAMHHENLLGPASGAPLGDHRRATMPGLSHSAALSQVPLLLDEYAGQNDLFPTGQLDQDLQQVDLRDRNSWRMLMADVPSVELLEVQLVNAIAPFIINARLKALMQRTPERDKHIVNVSAVEGQFYRKFKTTRHPHTNMAKAALNMMTRTAATDYHGSGIHMNAVDTGWVTDEDPIELAEKKTAEHRFHPPLDIVDGAARIVDPIIDGLNTGQHVWGQFLKDYRPADW